MLKDGLCYEVRRNRTRSEGLGVEREVAGTRHEPVCLGVGSQGSRREGPRRCRESQTSACNEVGSPFRALSRKVSYYDLHFLLMITLSVVWRIDGGEAKATQGEQI